MGYLAVVVVIVLIAILAKPDKSKSKAEMKMYIEKKIDDLAGAEVITQWKQTDDLLNLFLTTFRDVGYFVADSTGGGEWIKTLVDVFAKIFQDANVHYLYVHSDDLKAFGNILTIEIEKGTKPLVAGVVFRFVIVRGVSQEVTRAFLEETRIAGLPFKIVNAAGQVLSGGLAAGTFFAYADITTTLGTMLLLDFVGVALTKGQTATGFWWNQSAIVSPTIIVVSKEAIMARVDP